MNKSLITIVTIIALTLAPHLLRGEQAIVCSQQQALFCDDFESGLNPLWIQSGDCTWSLDSGYARASVIGSGLGCSMSVPGTTWTDYTFELDVRGNSGVDKAVGFRNNGDQAYCFSIRSDLSGDEAYLSFPGHDYAQIVNFPSQNGVWYHVEITSRGNHIVIKVDGTKIIDDVDLSNSCPSGGIIIGSYSGGAGVCDVSFDNVVVTHKITPGDADGSGIVTISDVVFLINYIFSGGSAPSPLSSGDADCSGAISISDAVYLIQYIFGGGPMPCEV